MKVKRSKGQPDTWLLLGKVFNVFVPLPNTNIFYCIYFCVCCQLNPGTETFQTCIITCFRVSILYRTERKPINQDIKKILNLASQSSATMRGRMWLVLGSILAISCIQVQSMSANLGFVLILEWLLTQLHIL